MTTIQWALAIFAFSVMVIFAVLFLEAFGEGLRRLAGRLKHKSWKGL